MRGIVLTRFGEPAEVLELKTLSDPPPPGPGEVVIRVTKRSLHPGNLAMIRGRFNIPLPAVGFLVPGTDGVGVIEAVGAGVDGAKGLKPGVRVIFNPSPGAWAELLKTRAEMVTPIPDDLPDAIATQLLPNAVIALLLIRAAQRLAPDAGRDIPILLTAAGSAVAHLVIVAAGRRGLKMIGAVRSAAGAEALCARFPDLVVVSTAEADWIGEIRRAAGERPLQVIMDAVGGVMVGHLARLLGDNGALLFYGGLAPEPITFSSIGLAHHEIMFKGVSSARWLQNTSPEQRHEDVREAIEIGGATPERFEVEADYDLPRFADAIKHIERSDRDGAVLISSNS
jgi:NADPH2:quinone reductase